MIQTPAYAARPCLRLLSFWQKRVGYSEGTVATNATIISRSIVSNSNEYDATLATTKPWSARPVETRKSQLIRTYTSLLRTTPLILFFQHNNLTAVEWAAVRRELKKALEAVPQPVGMDSLGSHLLSQMQLQVVRTNMLSVALKIVEFHRPGGPTTPRIAEWSGAGAPTHDLSDVAYKAARNAKISPDSAYAQLEPLLVGPLAALILPTVSPTHLAAALSVLAPVSGKFQAPTRKKSPGYHDPICQNGLAKLLLVGGRIEGKIFDQSGLHWVGSINGGMEGLRSQLVGILQGAGLEIAMSLERGSRSLWLALDGRRFQLDNQDKED
ncbi:hypothetical protein E4U42_004283 [Claviceps africana]|uniref:Ribosomal protein YmL11, mitochondrial n=1 Tax=Claviceps africana TaxID=83212 RepID=A0A8K0J7Q4_9HYPO|nr:hypothetical protein E4U42_004283 [Claviceps africana]